MVNQEILGGLKSSINRGESLQKAMTTFFNAGYKREEIEEAARAFQQEKVQISQTLPTKPIEQKKKLFKKTKPVSKVSTYGEPLKKPKKKAGKWLLISIITAAIIFLGLLIAFLIST